MNSRSAISSENERVGDMGSDVVKISKTIVDMIFEQARGEAPIEACGYLVGKDGAVIRHFAMTNVDKSTDHFSLDPVEQFGVLKAARSEGLEIIGVYHSHPESPARPSAEDLKLAVDPNMIYVIASIKDKIDTIKAFRIKEGNIREEILEIEE